MESLDKKSELLQLLCSRTGDTGERSEGWRAECKRDRNGVWSLEDRAVSIIPAEIGRINSEYSKKEHQV